MSSVRKVVAALTLSISLVAVLIPSNALASTSIGVGQGSAAPKAFIDAYNRGGQANRIGRPVNTVHSWGSGCVQDFRGGYSAQSAIMQRNCIGPAYFVIYGQWKYIVSTWGGNAPNVIGYPSNDAFRNGNGWYQNFVGGARQRTVIARADSTQVEKSVWGNILTYWLANGGATGKFRYPKTDSYKWSNGHRQDFEGGSIYWTASNGAVTLAPPPPPTTRPPAVSREQKAADWAIAEKNSPNPRWSDEFGRAWSGYCEGFAEVAYGTRGQFPSAYSHYLWQLNSGRIRKDANPPVGALVFYGGGGGYGHIGVSIGSGQVISTQGFDKQYLPVWQHTVTGISNPYYGWAYAPNNWPGR